MDDCVRCNRRPAEPGRTLCKECHEAHYSTAGMHQVETDDGYLKERYSTDAQESKGKVRTVCSNGRDPMVFDQRLVKTRKIGSDSENNTDVRSTTAKNSASDEKID